MSEPSSTPAGDAPSARHASWLELFFDLVVVVAVAQVSHRLHDPTWAELGISLLLFGAICVLLPGDRPPDLRVRPRPVE